MKRNLKVNLRRPKQFRLCIVLSTVSLFIFLSGCDGGLKVRGQLEPSNTFSESDCEISLWSGASVPQKYRSKKIGEKFDFHWRISGPKKQRWIEIECPGYAVYKTETFEAPSQNRNKDLGVIKLQSKKSTAKSP